MWWKVKIISMKILIMSFFHPPIASFLSFLPSFLNILQITLFLNTLSWLRLWSPGLWHYVILLAGTDFVGGACCLHPHWNESICPQNYMVPQSKISQSKNHHYRNFESYIYTSITHFLPLICKTTFHTHTHTKEIIYWIKHKQQWNELWLDTVGYSGPGWFFGTETQYRLI
jgi:hypothetical protein